MEERRTLDPDAWRFEPSPRSLPPAVMLLSPPQLMALGQHLDNNFAGTKRQAQKRTTMGAPGVADVQRLIAAAESTDPVLASAIALGAVTAARRGELCALRWS